MPRAPRAKPRANSVGALSREAKKDSANSSFNSICSRNSENRRPTNESPFTHARVHLLQRERNCVDNQVFEMGPKFRSSSLDRRDNYERGHALAKENSVNEGMPWCKPKEEIESYQPKERRSTLQRERKAADQVLEWVPSICQVAKTDGESEVRSHARVNINAREVGNAAQTLEMAPGVQICRLQELASESHAAVGPRYHGRKNVMARQFAEDSSECPIASGFADEGVPTYNRKSLLPPYVPRAPLAAH